MGSIPHGQQHQLRVADRVAIVAEPDAAGCSQLSHFRELFTRSVFGKTADGKDINPGCFEGCGILYIIDRGSRINRRISIGHTADGCESAMCCRCCARRDCLFLLIAGFSQMTVKIYESGASDEAAGIDTLPSC